MPTSSEYERWALPAAALLAAAGALLCATAGRPLLSRLRPPGSRLPPLRRGRR